VGPIVAGSVVDFFSNPSVNAELDRLLEEVIPQAMEAAKPAKTELAGKTFVFTGTMEKLSRKEAQGLIETLGGKTASSVSSKTDYVVHGPGAGSKLEKARELKIQLLDEEEFLEFIGEEPG
jgi:DNA ligase (NAD+)